MNSRPRRTLGAIFEDPVRSNIAWAAIESLLGALVTFQGTSVEELKQAFEDSIDDYLEFCEERGEEPDKPFSGKFLLRIDPNLHRRLHELSAGEGESLNAWVAQRLERLAGSEGRP